MVSLVRISVDSRTSADAVDVYVGEPTIDGTREYLLVTVPRGRDVVEEFHSGRWLVLRERFDDHDGYSQG